MTEPLEVAFGKKRCVVEPAQVLGLEVTVRGRRAIAVVSAYVVNRDILKAKQLETSIGNSLNHSAHAQPPLRRAD